MHMKINYIAFACFFLLPGITAKAQGCSDAGFCTLGNLNLQKSESGMQKGSTLSFILPVGIGDENVFVATPGIEYNNVFSSNWWVQAKLTANYASGNLGSAIGLGDVYLSGTYGFDPSASWKTSATLGVKLPLNLGNLKENGLSLPMQYQSSLGTVDLISGVAISNQKWQFAAGWQQPLTGINRNNFLPVYWNKPSAEVYPPTNDFNRKGDVLLRTAYTLSTPEKWSVTGGLLGIYHLGRDTYIDANTSAKPIAIEGSQGLTLNATAIARYQISNKITIGLSGGVPLVVREVRPDGLTRRFVIAPELIFKL